MRIEEKVNELLSTGFQIGNALSEIESFAPRGRRQRFEYVSLYENAENEAYEVHGAILAKYVEYFEMEGDLGFPASDELDDDVPGGRINFFDHGYISWTPAGGAEVHYFRTEDSSLPQDTSNEPDSVLAEKLQQAADYAFSMLSLPLKQSNHLIQRSENFVSGTSWCGYTIAHFYRQAGAEPRILTSYFGGVDGLLNYGSYYRIDYDPHSGELVSRPNSTKHTQIKDESGLFVDLEEFHISHGVSRKIILFSEIQQETPLDILAGDIVLFDHKGKSGPDHIQIVYQWHEADRLLFVIDGNGASFVRRITGAHEAHLSENDISKDLISKVEKLQILNDRLGLDLMYTYDADEQDGGRFGMTMHRLTQANQVNTTGLNSTSPHARIWAIIRPSRADFEAHHYQNL